MADIRGRGLWDVSGTKTVDWTIDESGAARARNVATTVVDGLYNRVEHLKVHETIYFFSFSKRPRYTN